MRRLWDFIAEYPSSSTQFTRRRLSPDIFEDPTWWNKLLPKYNGVLFINSQARPVFQVYIDACLERLGRFFHSSFKLFWDQTIPILEQSMAFIALLKDSRHINVHKLEVLLVAFYIWVPN